ALAELRRALPGYQFRVLENQATFIQNAVSEVGETALVGILLAIVVLYIFLRQIGTTAIISIAIPISIIATFNLMFFNGLTLNIMTLGGLALGAGMLVDNAIVVMENIFRHLENGRPLFEAAQQGAAEVGGAISASTFTTIIVFLPIVYLQGAAGELFKDQAWTVAFSLISSLAVALLVIPMLSARFINVEKIRHNEGDAPYPGYGRFLEKTLSRRGSVLAGALALVLLATALIPFVGSEFMPASDSNRFAIHLRLEEGTELRHTYQAAIGMENVIREIVGEDLEDIYVRVGPSPGLSGSINSFDEDTHTATLTIFLKSGHRVPVQRQIARLRASLPSDAERELTYDASESSLQQTLGITEAPIIVEFDGDELEVLRSLTDQARSLLDSLPEITAMESNFDNGRPEINVRIDRLVAGLNNIDITGVSGQIQDRLEGEEAGDWEYEGEMRGIRVQSPKLNLSELGALLIESNGRRFRLDEVATLEEHQAPREIFRQGQSRTGRLFIQLGDDLPLDRVVAQVRGKLSAMPLPDGYRMRITGEEEQREEAFGSLGFAFLLSIILIYMVLAAQFESLIHPFTIIFSVPLAGVGAVLLFFLLGMPFNMMAFIGIIMLVGIAVNDAIILVDAVRQLRSDGMDLLQSVIAAGQRRFRPILMTSLTTILALLPLTIGFGESANLRSPMALAVIGGLVTSTLLTLVVIPCLYVAFDRLTPGRDASR
ncbi:MAG TPA: efflux RND transporter permease subunit, partial [Calditrichia bacterium]|nr:efflux RND transporter permease subunit [Calditrichia bacterium]